jgi:WhiB family transcriptional regulator, redox-sensing transcriptional regulator
MAIIQQGLTWQVAARCVEVDPEIFFPERGGSSKAARAVCNECTVRVECLRYALTNREQFGIWGGTSERERRRLRRLSPSRVTLAS